MISAPPVPSPRPIKTVLGDRNYAEMGITDAHNHVWIDAIEDSDPFSPVLNDFDAVSSELKQYAYSGGKSLLDCQPGGCGRDGRILQRLSLDTGVNIVACTGFHRKKYYPPGYWLFTASETTIADKFISELTTGLEETLSLPEASKAGFIKLALESLWEETPQNALAAAAEAARQSGALIEIHTEKGALAEQAVAYFERRGLKPAQLVLCHMDKQPDFNLHAELCTHGVMVEYDTFFRPKYNPEQNLWPLILRMENAGLSDRIALATDMAEKEMYKTIGNGPGLARLPGEIKQKLADFGIQPSSITNMLGGNIARRLAGFH